MTAMPDQFSLAWATKCSEYKVTAVQVMPSNWQTRYRKQSDRRRIAAAEPAE